MKKLLPFLILLTVAIGCKKDSEEKPAPEYFKEPVLDWSLTKQGVIAKEERTLTDDIGPEEIIWLDSKFESKGSGSLEFTGDNIEVGYGFYCNAETLVFADCEFNSNSIIETELTDYMIQKYGKQFDERMDGLFKKMTWEEQGVSIRSSNCFPYF